MGEDWIAGEIARLRKTTELAGPARLACEVIEQAYLDAHATRPDVKVWRGRRAIEGTDPAGFLAGDGKAIYLALNTRREARGKQRGERLG